ncbi:S-layer homology domain-containing protein [Paenibacillus paridis]|uniref:S-layer homology domain-containing protein n=1 Tax=Paenibacillus paridis TaxID=2583376 RepID=UPI001391DB0B|nr:S-layer homology domain-containing protein [Paenibacillus paridis]
MLNCKRFIIVSMMIGLLTMAMSGLVFAAEAPIFTMQQEKADHEVRIVLTADKLSDMYAFEAKLTFDPSKLRFKSEVSGMSGFSITPIVEGNQLVIATTKIGKKAGENGKLALSTLLFEPIGTGAVDITMTDVKLVNSSLQPQTLKPQVKLTVSLGGTPIILKDIAGHWAKAAIERGVTLGFINGYSDGTFRPNAQVTRAEFATMLVRALELKTNSGVITFKDAGSIPKWAESYVATAAAAGIVAGYEDQTFRPSKPINRSEIAVMVARALKWPADSTEKSTFADREQIPAWAEPAVAMAAQAGVMKGRGANLFVPAANATRAEAATLLLAMIDLE